jgi:hypothetical protein
MNITFPKYQSALIEICLDLAAPIIGFDSYIKIPNDVTFMPTENNSGAQKANLSSVRATPLHSIASICPNPSTPTDSAEKAKDGPLRHMLSKGLLIFWNNENYFTKYLLTFNIIQFIYFKY